MTPRLEKLLAEIDPSRTIDVVERRVERVLTGYRLKSNTVDSLEDFKKCLADFARTARNAVLRVAEDVGDDLERNYNYAMSYLEREYGSFQTVYQIMVSGAEGGVYKILSTLAQRIADDFAQNEIATRVDDYWRNSSHEERLAAPEEYVRKYHDILPQNSLMPIKISFRQALYDHPGMIKRLRQLGTYR